MLMLSRSNFPWCILLLFGWIVLHTHIAQAALKIDTIAGGIPSNISATAIALGNPNDVAVDPTGNFLIITSNQNFLLKVNLQTGNLTHLAGNGTEGFSGDEGEARNAQLNNPTGVTIDQNGNIFFADQGNVRIRKIDGKSGKITTIAGTGTNGFSGDQGPAILAQLGQPTDVAVDRSGYLYIADETNHRIRRVELSTGIITTIGGTGEPGSLGNEGPAIHAQLNKPNRVALDQWGNLFFIDGRQGTIRRISKQYGVITKVAGGPIRTSPIDKELGYPTDLAVDWVGRLVIANARLHRIQRLSGLTTGQRLMTLAGPGPGIQTYSKEWWVPTFVPLNNPGSVAVDSDYHVFIADRGNFKVVQFDAQTGQSTIVAGNGHERFSGKGRPSLESQLSHPMGIANDSFGNVFIAEPYDSRVRRVNRRTGLITTVAGTGIRGFSGDGGLATEAELEEPFDVATDKVGNLFILEKHNQCIRRVDADSGIISTIAGKERKGYGGDGGPAILAGFDHPSGIAIDSMDNIFIADSSIRRSVRIRRIDARTGIINTIAGTGQRAFSGDGGPATKATLNPLIWGFVGMAVDPVGNLFISDSSNSRIRRVDAVTGIITTVAGSGSFKEPGAALIDTPNNLDLPSDADIDPNGSLAAQVRLGHPTGLALDSNGHLYFADSNRIHRVDANTNILTTIAGSGSRGFSGDKGPAKKSEFAYPHGLAIDPTGNLLIADTYNHKIREITTIGNLK